MSEVAQSSAMGPALFVGLSVFVAVTQGEPETVFANPADTMPINEVAAAPLAMTMQVPRALTRPFAVKSDVQWTALSGVAAISTSAAPQVFTQSWPRPNVLAPALGSAPDVVRVAYVPGQVFDGSDAVPRQITTPTTSPTPGSVPLVARETGARPEPLAPRLGPHLQGQDGPSALERDQTITRPAPSDTLVIDHTRALPAKVSTQTPPSRATVVVTAALGTPTITGVPGGFSPLEAVTVTRAVPSASFPDLVPDPKAHPKPQTVTLDADRVFLRQTPDLKGQIIGQFDSGTVLRVYEQRAKWARVQVVTENGGQNGWMWRSFLIQKTTTQD